MTINGLVLAVIDSPEYRPVVPGCLLVGLTVAEIAACLPASDVLTAWEKARQALATGRVVSLFLRHPITRDTWPCVADPQGDGIINIRMYSIKN